MLLHFFQFSVINQKHLEGLNGSDDLQKHLTFRRTNDILQNMEKNKTIAAIVPIEAYEEMRQQRGKAFSVLDRIWEKVPVVSKEEAHADIEQAIVEGRVKKSLKRNKGPL